MPRYYFHILHDGRLIRDEEGIECPDINAMSREATQSARDLVAQRVQTKELLDRDVVEVHDERGQCVKRVKLSDMLH